MNATMKILLHTVLPQIMFSKLSQYLMHTTGGFDRHKRSLGMLDKQQSHNIYPKQEVACADRYLNYVLSPTTGQSSGCITLYPVHSL